MAYYCPSCNCQVGGHHDYNGAPHDVIVTEDIDLLRLLEAQTSRIDQLQRDLDRLLTEIRDHGHDYFTTGRYRLARDKRLYDLAQEIEAGHREKEEG